VDLRRVRGSGAGGEILTADIEAAAKSATQAAPSGSRLETPGPIGRLMAERMTLSWTTVPQFFVMREVEVGALVALREKIAPPIAQSHGVKPTLTDMLAALVARVLKQHPRMNASWNGDGGILIHKEINVGIAVAVEDGVVRYHRGDVHDQQSGDVPRGRLHGDCGASASWYSGGRRRY
jgi:pyruvate dehydrogenase E2 component (dihydrolipoamide acetyltransferase)